MIEVSEHRVVDKVKFTIGEDGLSFLQSQLELTRQRLSNEVDWELNFDIVTLRLDGGEEVQIRIEGSTP